MVVVRIVVVLAVLAAGVLIGMWMFTGQRRFLVLAWQVGRLAIIALGIFFGLLLMERLIPL
jgi:hypothetical protein